MSPDARPRVYLLLCLVALFLEGAWILVHRPEVCGKCKTALVPSREFPAELCQPCVDQIRAVLGAPAPTQGGGVVVYEPPYPIDPSDPVVTLETSRGKVQVELFAKRAPISTENFLRYARAHHYDGVIFHRIEDYLCVSGRNRGGYGKPLVVIPQFPPIASEAGLGGLGNRLGTISLPHADGDADSATSDFFFNVKDNPFYDRPRPNGYAVFGQVIRGFDVVHAMRFLPVVAQPWPRFPADPITIHRVYEEAPLAGSGAVSALESRTQTGR
jgi:cyclophilin family peptidyl-prolyl cis-trans isomerase